MSTSTSISCSSTKARESVDFLYTEIGRGHPFYLDGILESLPRSARGEITNVFAATSGLAHAIWCAAGAAYRLGSSCGGQTSFYSRLRHATDYNIPGPLLRIAGRPLQRHFAGRKRPLVVAHPILTALLRGHPHLIYQHGEVVVPPECLIHGEHTILVPTGDVAQVFIEAGASRENLIETGLCIEPALATQAAAMQEQRQQRYREPGMLTGGFFSSGAEPASHVKALVTAAISTLLRGGRALIVARKGGPYARYAKRAFARRGLTLCTRDTQSPPGGALLRTYADRAALDRITREHFNELDYVVSPAHERTNWALGLGMPMFIVDPPIGTFAPRNRDILLAHGVAESLTGDGESFGAHLEQCRREGILAERSAAGWGRYPINGFEVIAELLA